MTKNIAFTLILGTFLVGQAPFAFAQDVMQPTTVTVPPVMMGTIKIAATDKSGTVVKARLVVKSIDGKNVTDGDTGASGGAVVFTLPPGAYTVTAEARGYAQAEQASFKIQAGANESLLVTMTPVYSPDPTRPQPTLMPPFPVPPVPPTRVCPFEYLPVLKRGSRGDAVKELQKTLGLPSDLQTGFYGPATESKVKEVEDQYRLPKTGVVDEDLRPIFFPCYQVMVLAPNGGEVWNAGETHQVSWAVEAPYLKPLPLLPSLPEGANAPRAGVKEMKKGEAEVDAAFTPPGQLIRPVRSYLSVDLVQYGGLVAHIGIADIFGGTQSLSWIIPKHIPAGAYRVRVSVQGSPVYYDIMSRREQVSLPFEWRGSHWDESDDEFKIVNGGVTPPPPSNPKLKEQMAQLLRMLEEMQRLVREMIAGL